MLLTLPTIVVVVFIPREQLAGALERLLVNQRLGLFSSVIEDNVLIL